MVTKQEESFDFGRLLIFAAIAFGIYYFVTNKKDIIPGPGPGPDPAPIVSNDFPEPSQALKNLLPDINTRISGRRALDLAYLYRNIGQEVLHNENITTVGQIVEKHKQVGAAVERNNEYNFSLKLAKQLDEFMLSDLVAGNVSNSISSDDRRKIANGFAAIAWGFFQSAGEEGVRELHAAFYNCNEDQCPIDEAKYLEYIQNISSQIDPTEHTETINGDEKLLLMQAETEDNQTRGPPIDENLTHGLIVDMAKIVEFNKQIPQFQQFGYDGSGRGKTALLYESVLKYDKEAFTERQVTGDCFFRNDISMGIESTYVQMNDGTRKAIENIQPGEYVINAYNEISEVKSTFNKKFTGTAIQLKIMGDYKSLTCTPDHLFIVCQNKELVWKRADSLQEGDSLLVPFGDTGSKTYTFDLQNLSLVDLENNPRRANASDGYVRIKGGRHHIKRYVTLDEDLGWLFGIFFAEGGIRYENGHPMGVDFSLNRKEVFFSEEIKRICKEKFDYDVKFYDWDKKPNVRIVRINSAILGEFFYNQCPGKINSKSLTTCIFQSPLEVRQSVLKGWFDGDGHINKHNAAHAVSISEQLVNDMNYLAKTLVMNARQSYRIGKPNNVVKSRQDSYFLHLSGHSTESLYPETIGKVDPQPLNINAFGFERPIKSIRRIPVKNVDVYCIEVPNKSSFIANGIAVHNCTSHGTRNAVDISRAYEIDKLGEDEEYVARGATEPIYGARGHGGQGMSVDRAVDFVSKKGGLAVRKNYTDLGIDLSKYDPKDAIVWGRSGGTPERLLSVIKANQIENVSLINSADEACDALSNGFAIVTGSMHSFPSKRDEYGIAKRNGRSWAHCICFGAVTTISDLTNGKVSGDEPYFLYINSWGPNWIAGPEGKYDIPDGAFWISKSDADFMIKQQQTYAVSNFRGFAAQKRTTFGFEWLD